MKKLFFCCLIFFYSCYDILNNCDVEIENGSLLVMKGKTQHFWQHSIPKRLKVKQRRVNLTFRTIL